ncbi:pdia2 protein [Lynx pardinus]|uniref:protein disulfide-isomerase n=1 Tax=Lynx pardinus TaxID=191816 RepID=A0A485P097_LYNPA|nr:pdia2 protein [Lynx pardinus]
MDGQLLLVLLLLLLLGASGPEGQGPGPGEPEEEPPKEEIPEEDGILVLSRRNLGLALREHRTLLVQFYAPWCGHCKALAPEYSKAAALLAAESAKARLAKVDGPAETELTEEFAVTAYPTLKFFRDGNRTHPEEYTGPREAEGIAEWLRRRAGPSATRLEDEDGAQALIDGRDVVVIGFFQDLQDEDVATFLALAQDALDMTFGLTDQPKLFQKFGLTKDTVVLFKKVGQGQGGGRGSGPWLLLTPAELSSHQAPPTENRCLHRRRRFKNDFIPLLSNPLHPAGPGLRNVHIYTGP